MKKYILIAFSLFVSSFLLNSCATVFGGGITACQKQKPSKGEPKRKIRPVAFVGDIVIGEGIGLIVDFANGAIYKPCRDENKNTSLKLNNTVEISNTSKEELYNRAKKWIAENFKSGKDVIQLDDKENGKIIIKGCTYVNQPHASYYWFTFSFDCKDNKYKYEFYDCYIEPSDTRVWSDDMLMKKHLKVAENNGQQQLNEYSIKLESNMKISYQNKDW